MARPFGMTLVEVLVAAVLLGVGVAGLMSIAALALRNQHRSEERSMAAWLANEKLSEVAQLGPRVWLVSQPMSGTEPRGRIGYSWSLDIEAAADGLIGEMFIVIVDVEWTSFGGQQGSVRMETWLNDYEAAALIPQAQRDQMDAARPSNPSQR